MTINGTITQIEPGKGFHVFVPFEKTHILEKQKSTCADVRICDGRCVSPEQTAKAKILTRAISNKTGYSELEIDSMFKRYFCLDNLLPFEYFSLGDCEMSIARDYITFLVDWCLDNDVPILSRTDRFVEDWHRYIYKCIENRLCAVSGRSGADIHHCTGSKVRIGRNRNVIIHEGLVCIPLLREYHNECHNDEVKFMDKYKLFGIPLDKYLCEKLGLNTEAD